MTQGPHKEFQLTGGNNWRCQKLTGGNNSNCLKFDGWHATRDTRPYEGPANQYKSLAIAP